jgi:phosphohistidine phosphatase
MKRLILVRHAKSSWKYIDISDHDRPLKEKGIIKTNIVSEHMSGKVDNVDIIYSSSAIRALHTAVIFCQNLELPSEKIVVSNSLYNMLYNDFIEFVKNIDNNNGVVMMFIHNPLITILSNKLGELDLENVPTTGVIDIKFNIDNWADIEKGGKVINYITPKLL